MSDKNDQEAKLSKNVKPPKFPKNVDLRSTKPPTEEEWLEAVSDEAMKYCPPIRPCQHCEWPVVKGCCCNFCGSSDS